MTGAGADKFIMTGAGADKFIMTDACADKLCAARLGLQDDEDRLRKRQNAYPQPPTRPPR
jgi:hypothetical protein